MHKKNFPHVCSQLTFLNQLRPSYFLADFVLVFKSCTFAPFPPPLFEVFNKKFKNKREIIIMYLHLFKGHLTRVRGVTRSVSALH